MSLLASFLEFIRRTGLPLPGEGPALLAVSGGVDSMVLADLFRRQGWPFAVAHANFQLRGAEADADEDFVRSQVEAWGLPFWTQRFDTQAFAHEQGLSVQMAARQLRYEWFEQLRAEQDYACIVTGHHLNDAVETMLLNLARGTGLRGLGGIPAQQGRVVRPLLFATRAEILAHARAHDLSWREDSSNADEHYARNLVRHQLLPPLMSLNPNFLSTAGRTLNRLRAAEANLDYLLQALGETLSDGRFRLEKSRIAALPAPEEALRRWLEPFGFTAEQGRQVAENLSGAGGEWSAPDGVRLVQDQRYLWVLPVRSEPLSLRIEADDLLVKLPDETRLVLTPALPDPPFPDGRTAVLVDADQLQFPLLLRPWQPGDAFQPLGMGGKHQKMQDFFTDHKFSRLDKEKAWLLVNADGAVIWLLGWRPDERFKISAATTKALKITWLI